MKNLTSDCCNAQAFFGLGNTHGIYMEGNTYTGICSECKEHAIFECEGDE